ncbi:unnamed protein product, partial [Staurois parvus]
MKCPWYFFFFFFFFYFFFFFFYRLFWVCFEFGQGHGPHDPLLPGGP